MILGFIDGIGKSIGNLVESVKGIGNKIKSFLHFSRPDEGPLRDYEKWMPDMVDGLSKTLNASAPKLYNASKQLASKIASNLDISSMLNNTPYLINTDVVSNMKDIPLYSTERTLQPQNTMYDTMRRVIEDIEFHNNNQQHLSIYYMGKEIFDDTIDYINEKTRRTGKCVIKTS